jgi:hypothetical protein
MVGISSKPHPIEKPSIRHLNIGAEIIFIIHIDIGVVNAHVIARLCGWSMHRPLRKALLAKDAYRYAKKKVVW